MKKILPALLFLIVSYTATAQLKIGFLGGANRSSVLETNSLANWSTIKPNYSALYGAHGGIFAEIPLNKKGSLVFQPGATYFNKGRKYAQSFDTSVSLVRDTSSTLRLNYVDIPFNLVLKFSLSKKVKFMIGAGPYVSFFFKGSQKTQTTYKNGTSSSTSNTDLPVGNGAGKFKTMDYGANVMAGFEIGHFFLRGDASQSLGDFYQASYDGHFKHQVISGSIGFTINLKNPAPAKKKEKTTEPKKTKEPKKSKTKDKDGDGVADKDDLCPDEAGTPATKGCPDKDGDGVADKDDKCPDVMGTAANQGCPAKDTDGDGIPDDIDKCPLVKGEMSNNGCPSATGDSDGDGIPDNVDKCPTVAGLYRYDGCPIPDTDGDGVNDEIDHCKTVPGLATNHGCPAKTEPTNPDEVKTVITDEMKKVVDETAGKITFKKINQVDLSADAMATLNKVYDLLVQNPKLRLQIDGHASKEGTYYINRGLSNERANSVRNYLSEKGIDRSRLRVDYYGADKPVTNDPAKQAMNRRVELSLF